VLERQAMLREEHPRPTQHGMPLYTGLDRTPNDSRKLLRGSSERDATSPGSFNNRCRQGMLRALFSERHQPEQLLCLLARGCQHIGQLWLAAGYGPSFIEQHSTHGLETLQTLTALNPTAVFRPFPSAHPNTRRRCQ